MQTPSFRPARDPSVTDQPPAGTRSRLFARAIVAATILLAAVLVASMYVHSHRVREPSTAIVIVGDPTFRGARIVVTPAGDNDPTAKPLQLTLDDKSNYQLPVFELPGQYHVTITWRDQTLFDNTLSVDRVHGKQIDLPSVLEIIGDDSMDDAQVLLSSADGGSTTRTLTKAEHERLRLPLPAGKYSLSVTRDGKTLAEAEFELPPHAPGQVDLRKRS